MIYLTSERIKGLITFKYDKLNFYYKDKKSHSSKAIVIVFNKSSTALETIDILLDLQYDKFILNTLKSKLNNEKFIQFACIIIYRNGRLEYNETYFNLLDKKYFYTYDIEFIKYNNSLK